MTNPTVTPTVECDFCPPHPTCAPMPAPHTSIDEWGPAPICSSCLIAEVLEAERVGYSAAVSVTRAQLPCRSSRVHARMVAS